MDVVFEIDRNESDIIKEIEFSAKHIKQVYETNGLNGMEIVTIVVALIPPIRDLILKYFPNPSVTIMISNEFGSIEITAKSVKQAEQQIDAYLEMSKDKTRDVNNKV